MTTPTVLTATWGDGLFVITGENRHHELAGQPVSALASDGHGGALAIVSGHSLRRRTSDGQWITIATSESQLACCAPVGDLIYIGTDDARVLRVSANGNVEQLRSFDVVAGRDTWYAGSAVINGQRVGPPLGIRSITATADGRVLLANVHVGGVPRSTDSGATWQPTIDIDTDVHQVCAHPTDPNIVIAAAGVGLCISQDGGATWTVEQDGLHASYCSAVAFLGNDVLVAASTDHFATQGAVYRRAIDARRPFVPVGGGLPRWIDGIADTRCIATRASAAAVTDRAGNLYLSTDAGRTWYVAPMGFHHRAVSSLFERL
jgi:photosystem II stability/assembly factor-like uncharacterized protein